MTSAAFGSARKHMRIRFRKKLLICSHELPFCVASKCVVVRRRSNHASLTQPKRDLKKEKIRSPSDAWKGYLKTWNQLNSQSLQGHCPWTPKVALTVCPTWTLSCNSKRADACSVMAYDHKTHSLMKNGVSKSAWIKPWTKKCKAIFSVSL